MSIFAYCQTCGLSIKDEWQEAGPFSDDDIDEWALEHRCEKEIVRTDWSL